MEKKQNTDKFEGYPHYPANEDITRSKNNNGKEVFEEEPAAGRQNDTVDRRDKETAIVPGTDADITDEDLRTLQASEQNMDTLDGSNLIHSALDNVDGDGDPLNEETSLDLTGEDLDIPGSTDDDADELIGEEDEENNYYSLGGDLHESQEENKGE
jgi:hypothetical protein